VEKEKEKEKEKKKERVHMLCGEWMRPMEDGESREVCDRPVSYTGYGPRVESGAEC
jgi:hypothetical protein